MAMAAAVIATLLPAREGVSAVPACSDCAFKLTGEYIIVQHGSYASLYLGTREVMRYGWAYAGGRPLREGESVACSPMYVRVVGGIAYVSCSGAPALPSETAPRLPLRSCSPYAYGWDGASNATPANLPYRTVTHGPEAWVWVDASAGNPHPSLALQVDGAAGDGFGVAALVMDLTGLYVPTSARISVEHAYGRDLGDAENNIAYMQITVRAANGSVVNLYLVRDAGLGITRVYDVVNGSARHVCDYAIGGGAYNCRPGHVVVRLGALSTAWAEFFSGSAEQYAGAGRVEAIALVAVDHGGCPGRGDCDFWIRWDNLRVDC
jgi:hypothetical protein